MEDGSDNKGEQVGGDKLAGGDIGGVPGGDVPATAGGGQGGRTEPGGQVTEIVGVRAEEKEAATGTAAQPKGTETEKELVPRVPSAGVQLPDLQHAAGHIVPGMSGGEVPAVQTLIGEKVDEKENHDVNKSNSPGNSPGDLKGLSESGKSFITAEAEKTTGDKEVHSAEDDGGLNKIGKNHFAAVYIPATAEEKEKGILSGVVRFTDQEAAVLTAFMRSADYEKTALEVQTNKDEPIKVDSVKRILRRPNLKRYINFQIRVHTVKDIDPDWAKAEVLPVWAGEKKVTDDQKWAMNSIIKLVTPKGGGVQVNVQQNSVYGNMGRETIDAEWTDARAAAADGV